jgi:transcriptional regulator with XRE-family HTH domain
LGKLHVAYVRHTEVIERVGNNLRRIRLEKGLSMEELSMSTEISINQISRIELGKVNTSISTLYELAKALDVDVVELFYV